MPKKSVPAAEAPAARSAAASPIVSSAHLVSPQSAELSEFEFGLIVAGNAFHRWITHCMSAAGLKDLTPLDVLVLHHVTHRARDKRLADICFIMNVEDTHLINYSLKKLLNLGVVVGSKNGKEVTYASTELGRGHVQRYREIREACLINALKADDGLNRDIGELGRLLRVLSGMYDQAGARGRRRCDAFCKWASSQRLSVIVSY
ncbi:MAG: winged helix DNA-binding protein [Betaproteobacteria bacterium]|nr:winged helix DNA-binding protein [Betaproteobacteria bacterium]